MIKTLVAIVSRPISAALTTSKPTMIDVILAQLLGQKN